MSPQETAYFWTWYKTGHGKTGRRSFRKTAKIVGKAVNTLIEMAESSEPTWYELAETKDAELAQKLDEAVIDSILSEAKEVLNRQRLVIRELFKQVLKVIRSGDIEYRLADIIKLMEYESSTCGAIRSEAGVALAGILQFLSSDVRSQLHRAVRDSRLDSGDVILGKQVESSSPH